MEDLIVNVYGRLIDEAGEWLIGAIVVWWIGKVVHTWVKGFYR